MDEYKIIVSRYNENIDWLESEMHNCIIFNKGEKLGISNEICIPNVGRESETYLNYIISNYENLPETIIFTQADISDHILNPKFSQENCSEKPICGDLLEKVKVKSNSCILKYLHILRKEAQQFEMSVGLSIKKSNNSKIFNSCDWISENQKDWIGWEGLKNKVSYLNNEKISFKDWFEKNLNQKFPKDEIILHMYGLFAIRKSRILKNDIEFYKNLIKSLNYNINPIEGHFFERSWHYIFNLKSEIIYSTEMDSQTCEVLGNNGKLELKILKNPPPPTPERSNCVKHLVYDAIQKYDIKIKFKFNVFMGDRPDSNSYSFSTVLGKYDETFPDWSFYAWETAGIKSFKDAIKSFPTSKPETNKIGWIGSLLNVKERKNFVEKFSDTHFSEAYTTQGCFNLKIKKPPKFMTHSEQILKWKYLIDIPGIGYSCRTKFLMHSNRVLFLVNSPYEEYWYQFLEPWKHYVPVKEDYSDLEENYYKVENDKNLHDFILNEQTKFAKKYITYESALSRIREIIIKNEN